MNISFNANNIINLIGLNRVDERIISFINQAEPVPEITLNKEDGGDDEYVEFKEKGFGLHFMNEVLVAIFFESGNNSSGYSRYQYPLPMGLRFEQSKTEILTLFGKPDLSGGGKSNFFGDIPDWLKYNFGKYFLHIQFTLDCTSIASVTFMNYE